MKNIAYILLALIAIMMLWLVIPQSCDKFGKSELLEKKSDRSLKSNSIQKSLTEQVNKKSDSLIRIYKDSVSILRDKNEKLSINYYALRAKIKHLQIVKVDSFTQIVKVPVIDYNASINSGTMCDSLLMYLDSELMLKDSIISVQDIVIKALSKKIETGEIANADLLELVAHLKEELKKCKNQNKALKIGLAIVSILHLTH